jgi:hypothetical protein
MRCPQCGERVPIDFASIRLTGDEFVLLQIKCEVCEAYIVLHASLQGMKGVTVQGEEESAQRNASSSLCLTEGEIQHLREVLKSAEGSFEQMFEEKTESEKKQKKV